MKHLTAMTASCAAMLLCCTATESKKPETVGPTASATVETQRVATATAPLIVTVQGPVQPVVGEQATIAVAITRRLAVPLDLKVSVPAGMRVLSGKVAEHIEELGQPTLRRELVVVLDTIPAQDLQVEVTTRGEGYGARAMDAYRFGREAPKLPVPQRGPAIRVNGRDLGQPIDLNK